MPNKDVYEPINSTVMTNILLDYLRSIFSPAAASELARTLSETPAATQKALDGLLPAITAGVINRAESDEGATTLHRLLKSTPFDTDPSMATLVETDEHRQKSAESGNSLLEELYGDRVRLLPEATAQYSGVSPASATTLSGVVMSILMGFLRQQMVTRNLSEPQLAALLRGESTNIRSAVPATLAGLLGWFIGTDTPRPVTTAIRPETVGSPVEQPDRAGTPWWRWLLYILIPLLLLLLLLRNCNGKKTETVATESTTAVNADTVASDMDGNGPEVRVAVDLPGGRKLNVAENSFNYSLATYLSIKGGQVPKVFTFDNLTFETNSAQITAQARPHVDDLIQIMQAYPSLNIRIEGNTDSTGNDAINDPLSADRADSVKAALVKAGIEASRVATRERGDTKPVASNQTEAGRQKNRRIDVVVTKI